MRIAIGTRKGLWVSRVYVEMPSDATLADVIAVLGDRYPAVQR